MFSPAPPHSVKLSSVIPSPGTCIRVLTALVLFGAAVMKAVQLATVPVLGEGLFNARWFTFCLVEFELGFGFWLLTGSFSRLTRVAVIVLFSLFCLVSLYKALHGEASCGCFGAAKVPPLWTALLDASLVAFALYFPPKVDRGLLPKRLKLAVVLWAAASLPVIAAAMSTRTSDTGILGREHIDSNGNRTIELEPVKWAVGTIPILPYIEPPEARQLLREGTWTVLFFQRDCLDCQSKIRDLAEQKSAEQNASNVVCLEIPPYGETEAPIPAELFYARLSDRYNWYIETPALFLSVRFK